MLSKNISSPSRRYVAICNKANFDGHYFRRFTLPDTTPYFGGDRNESDAAAWYFLNCLDAVACIEGVITEESFNDVDEVSPSYYP